VSVVTIRNLDPAAKRRIERRAVAHGRSMEAEMRAVLEAVGEPDPQRGVREAMRRSRTVLAGVEFELPSRRTDEQRPVLLP
jgi:plasmid stability protein